MWCQKIVSKANADLKYRVISAFVRPCLGPCKRAKMQNYSRNVQDKDSWIDGWLSTKTTIE